MNYSVSNDIFSVLQWQFYLCFQKKKWDEHQFSLGHFVLKFENK